MRLKIKAPFGDLAIGLALLLILASLAVVAMNPPPLRMAQRLTRPAAGWAHSRLLILSHR